MAVKNVFGQVFMIAAAAACLGLLALQAADRINLYLRGVPVQGTVRIDESVPTGKIFYHYLVDGQPYETGSGLLLSLRPLEDKQPVSLVCLPGHPGSALNKDDFFQSMAEEGLGMALAVLVLVILRMRAARPRKESTGKGN